MPHPQIEPIKVEIGNRTGTDPAEGKRFGGESMRRAGSAEVVKKVKKRPKRTKVSSRMSSDRDSSGLVEDSSLKDRLMGITLNDVQKRRLAQLTTGHVRLNPEALRPPRALYSGYLTKRGGKWHSWQKRWFVLAGGFLYYFDKDVTESGTAGESLEGTAGSPTNNHLAGLAPKGIILIGPGAGLALAEASNVGGSVRDSLSNSGSAAAAGTAFSIVARKSFTEGTEWKTREYLLRATTPAERDQWLRAIAFSQEEPTPNISRTLHSSALSDDLQKLFRFCEKGDVASIRSTLVSSKLRDKALTAMDPQGNTVLHTAAVSSRADVLLLLLESGFAVDTLNRDGFTALHCAMRDDLHEITSVLLQNSAKVAATNNIDNGNNALHYAACWNAARSAKLLIEAKIDINSRAGDGSTALSFAAERGGAEVARLLIDAGANIEAANDFDSKGGATPLQLAALSNQASIVAMLLQKQANANAKTAHGLTALHLAGRSDSDPAEVVRLLLKHGADLNAKTTAGDTPLHYCAFGGHVGACRVLLDAKADLEARGQNSSTALHFAARQGHLEVIKFLLSRSASKTAVDSDGDTPLGCAQVNGHASACEILKA